MEHLPIFLRVQGRPTLIVGGGAVAARKAELLLRCGADVIMVALELQRPARELLDSSHDRVRHVRAAFDPAHLDGMTLVIAATDSAETNAAVAAAARARNIPVNVVDDYDKSSFILPAIVDRAPVVVAVGTQGSAPVLARQLREQLESLLPARLGALARFAGQRRVQVQTALRPGERRRFWERVFGGAIATRVLEGNETAAESEFVRELAAWRSGARDAPGEVYLIGAGPGDPDLLTLRAVQLLQQADVILYDRLVSPAILDRARREAERIFVGKEARGPRGAQEEIHQLLLEHARRGRRVARLKGGDPLIFGRGGEEIQLLARHGIAVTVVPGITAALGAAASAGLALTQRDIAQSVTFAAGHLADNDALDWQALARPRHTVVFYMAVSQLETIVAGLLAAGAPADRPAALIERATLPEQRIRRAPLSEIANLARAERIIAPALLVVGEVAAESHHPEEALCALAGALRGVA
jgi:uroporphyrin-III C-methyltransferase/precorrin-2 dehydrogenase/sirohydrochlorin ferrochelatase